LRSRQWILNQYTGCSGARAPVSITQNREAHMAGKEKRSGEVLVQVCMECGKEYMFENEDSPDDLTCDKCGNEVFRSFYASSRADEASDDFRDSTERDVLTTDSASEVTRGDLHDLNNL
jgi:DNA-directed RNA polymerase subunit RPC12/RpoP